MTVNKSIAIKVFFCALILLNCRCKAHNTSVFHTIYAKETCTLLKENGKPEIAGLIKKGDTLLLLRPAFSFISDTTSVSVYKVRTGKGAVGYVNAESMTFDGKEALNRYKPEKYDSLHKAAIDRFHGGNPLGCDFFPKKKPVFKDKIMPESCYSLYITASPASLKRIDEYISLAKSTYINTFVIDIKEDGVPGFKADAMKNYCPSAYNRAGNNIQLYKDAVRKIHEAGYWAVGRIVTFKDYHFTKDHPECALWNKAAGEMLYHNKSNWPSAFCRKVWEYNVTLACEAVDKIGFDEINFDYVRFPDRMTSIESGIDMRNAYGESKIQAIQRFVAYAADQLHMHKAYISIDVFGESANPGYTTPYGQYWPAISNVADVICGMPYPDHFSNGYYGIQKPWNHPYEIMNAWGHRVRDRQAETPSPAIVRTWIQAYHVMRHVDRNGIDYNAENMAKEIRGLFDAGLTGGYTTWLSSGNLESYISKADAFRTDYLKEWKSRKNTETKNEENHRTAP